ncbi:MAG: hypothetical protein HYS98_03225 [Deltaproteobacteria bacterium]|nr:hypothetical protein [Deltaproteobacteria bacterium]
MKKIIILVAFASLTSCEKTGLKYETSLEDDPSRIVFVDPRIISSHKPPWMQPYRRVIERDTAPVNQPPSRGIFTNVVDKYEKKKNHEEADILWVIDNSCSMAEERDKVSQNLDAFMRDFKLSHVDFHMGVISTHTHDALFYGAPPVLLSNDPELERRFSERVRMPQVCGFSAALHAAHLALSEPRISGYNKDFLRSEAHLIIIIISDADEDYKMSSSEYLSFFQSLKASEPHKVVINSIVGDSPSGCSSAGGNAEPGLQYIELTQSTRGFFEIICSNNFKESMNNIGRNLDKYINSYPLTHIPSIRYPLVVTINGRVVERHPIHGWVYNAELNLILFEGDIKPIVGDKIEIAYLHEEN